MGYLNWNDRSHVKIYEAAIQPLPNIFDCEPAKLNLFVKNVRDRAKESGWLSTMMVQTPTGLLNLLENFGVLTTQQLYNHALTYIGQPSRHDQNSGMIYSCLSRSLTEEARQRVGDLEHEYTVNGEQDGLLYFKAIIKTTQVDTRATVTRIRNQLASLDQHMQLVDSDIKQFNLDVNQWRQALVARGERTEDLMVNLFKGYRACNDSEFREYIKRKEDAYDEGSDLTVDQLMNLALNKYQLMMDDKTWLQPTAEQREIVALTAKINQLTKQKAGNKNKSDNKSKSNKKGKGKGKKDSQNKDKKPKYPEWKSKAPKAGDPKTKEVKGRTYHWCSIHNLWTKHKESECKKKEESSNKDSGKSKAPATKLQLSANFAHLDDDSSYN